MSMTEFTDLDPSEFHLVSEGASGFPILLAKAKGEIQGVLDETGDLTKARWAGFCAEAACETCKAKFGVMHETLLAKAKLKTKGRNALPTDAFALPGTREYPIHDVNHAKAALSMLHNATPEQQSKIKAAVHRRYPEIGADVSAKKEGAPQASHEDGALPSASGSEGQTNENHPRMGPVTMDVTPDGYRITVPPFEGSGAPVANQEGHGSIATNTAIPTGDALSQTRENLRKEGDGRGDPAPGGDAEVTSAEAEARTQTEGNTRKGTPGDPEWEAQDVELAQQAGALIERLESRERAETGAEKRRFSAENEATIRRAAQSLSGLIDTTTATKELDDMTGDELVKMLDERDAAKDAAKAVAKAAKVAKAEKKAAKKSKGKKNNKPPMTDEEAAEKAAADPVWAAKQRAKADVKVAKQAAKTGAPDLTELKKGMADMGALLERIAAQPQQSRVPMNAAGIAGMGGAAAFQRGDAPAATGGLLIKERAPGEAWVPGEVKEGLAASGVIR